MIRAGQVRNVLLIGAEVRYELVPWKSWDVVLGGRASHPVSGPHRPVRQQLRIYMNIGVLSLTNTILSLCLDV